MTKLAVIVTDGGYGFTCDIETGEPVRVLQLDVVDPRLPRYSKTVWMMFMDYKDIDDAIDQNCMHFDYVHSEMLARRAIDKARGPA